MQGQKPERCRLMVPRRSPCLGWLLHALLLIASGIGSDCHLGHDTPVMSPKRAPKPPPRPSPGLPPAKRAPRPPPPKRAPRPPPPKRAPRPPPPKRALRPPPPKRALRPPPPKPSRRPPPPKWRSPPPLPSPRPPAPPHPLPRSPPPPYPPGPPRPPSPIRTRNGLRLVRGAAFIGRLEAFVVTDRLLQGGYEENGGWAPLCNDGSFDDKRALEFCNVMGRQYGRKFYGSGISTFGEDEEYRPSPVGSLQCVSPSEMGPGLPLGRIGLPPKFQKKCYVYPSSCGKGELVAIQCSDHPLQASKPPPPSPPAPPPPPPPAPNMAHAINIIPLELNLWDGIDPGYNFFFGGELSRVELLVNTSADGHDGELVWAPLCSYPPPAMLAGAWDNAAPDVVANTSCNQFADFPNSPFVTLTGHYGGAVSLLNGNLVNADDYVGMFHPYSYTHWVTVVGGVVNDLRSIQEMQLRVSTEPCDSYALFGLTCILQAF